MLIQISTETQRALVSLKQSARDTYDNVIRRSLDLPAPDAPATAPKRPTGGPRVSKYPFRAMTPKETLFYPSNNVDTKSGEFLDWPQVCAALAYAHRMGGMYHVEPVPGRGWNITRTR